ncbi:hypothetical protein ANANG_G00201210 [Anguilla anguilla]|uniref:Uncharacterized protein n=1 Tax=Anguilla anguilla TaxID=7936 RepID=A0A9D3LY44_ANGAN|nr:hypothetical protein ANANG_G00201210 [Anguilla anguilla]
MRGLSFNGVLSTTLLGLWMFFKEVPPVTQQGLHIWENMTQTVPSPRRPSGHQEKSSISSGALCFLEHGNL